MWRLKTFGALTILAGGEDRPPRVVQRRRLALLALLDAGGAVGMPRDRLLALLWPEASGAVARHSLAQLVYALRRQLGDGAVLSDGDILRLDPGAVASDRAEFETLLDRGELENALRCYAGAYLDGFGVPGTPELERWIDRERARLAARYALALETLAAEAERAGHHDRAATHWRDRAALDPLSAPVALSYMRALAAAGNVAAALQHARVHALLRREELELRADADVMAYADALRGAAASARERDGVGEGEGAGHPHTDEPTSAPHALGPPPAPASPTSVSSRWRPGRRHVVLAGALALAVIATMATLGVRRLRIHQLEGAHPSTPRLIVLSAFRASDASLGLAVHEAVRAELENTSGVRVLDDAQLAAALQRMEMPRDAALTDATTAELAQREGAALAVVGTVTAVGTGALIVVRLLDGPSGRAVATLTERPSSENAVLDAIARIARGVADRAQGVRGASVAAPLPAVTTRSLSALRDYALARQALGHFDRATALQALTAAVEEDSLFALARYLRADLLWFSDHEQEAERELQRALALSGRLPLRERLVVRARYEQLVADRTDSALAYWSLVRDLDRSQALAYEGMAWSYRAQGRWPEAAAVADTAMALDSSTVTPSATNRVYALLSDGDTAAAAATAAAVHARCPWLTTQVRFATALERRDWPGALRAAGDAARDSLVVAAPYRQVALLGAGRIAEARGERTRIQRASPGAQFTPRAMLAQAWVERARGGSARTAARAARDVLAWVERADLSAPAVARLTERAAELAARAGDTAGIGAARQVLVRADAGRGLPSYRLALLTVRAADAYARGDMRPAAELADESRRQMFFGRALAPLFLLEADARAALGEHALAGELYGLLRDVRASAGDDVETWALVREVAEERLAAPVQSAPRAR
ncbi:MAG TPA: BTAD domain-containing putative transcriptional regulator [Gemmatimonadaceae bacterium]|nr:BTAD domain-containing putative transcriptional regulator [Gemmatimonadaceae bacterium]